MDNSRGYTSLVRLQQSSSEYFNSDRKMTRKKISLKDNVIIRSPVGKQKSKRIPMSLKQRPPAINKDLQVVKDQKQFEHKRKKKFDRNDQVARSASYQDLKKPASLSNEFAHSKSLQRITDPNHFQQLLETIPETRASLQGPFMPENTEEPRSEFGQKSVRLKPVKKAVPPSAHAMKPPKQKQLKTIEGNQKLRAASALQRRPISGLKSIGQFQQRQNEQNLFSRSSGFTEHRQKEIQKYNNLVRSSGTMSNGTFMTPLRQNLLPSIGMSEEDAQMFHPPQQSTGTGGSSIMQDSTAVQQLGAQPRYDHSGQPIIVQYHHYYSNVNAHNHNHIGSGISQNFSQPEDQNKQQLQPKKPASKSRSRQKLHGPTKQYKTMFSIMSQSDDDLFLVDDADAESSSIDSLLNSSIEDFKKRGQSNKSKVLKQLKIMKFLENSETKNVFRSLKEQRSQSNSKMRPKPFLSLSKKNMYETAQIEKTHSHSRLVSVANNSHYQHLLKIRKLENELKKQRDKVTRTPNLLFSNFNNDRSMPHSPLLIRQDSVASATDSMSPINSRFQPYLNETKSRRSSNKAPVQKKQIQPITKYNDIKKLGEKALLAIQKSQAQDQDVDFSRVIKDTKLSMFEADSERKSFDKSKSSRSARCKTSEQESRQTLLQEIQKDLPVSETPKVNSAKLLEETQPLQEEAKPDEVKYPLRLPSEDAKPQEKQQVESPLRIPLELVTSNVEDTSNNLTSTPLATPPIQEQSIIKVQKVSKSKAFRPFAFDSESQDTSPDPAQKPELADHLEEDKSPVPPAINQNAKNFTLMPPQTNPLEQVKNDNSSKGLDFSDNSFSSRTIEESELQDQRSFAAESKDPVVPLVQIEQLAPTFKKIKTFTHKKTQQLQANQLSLKSSEHEVGASQKVKSDTAFNETDSLNHLSAFVSKLQKEPSEEKDTPLKNSHAESISVKQQPVKNHDRMSQETFNVAKTKMLSVKTRRQLDVESTASFNPNRMQSPSVKQYVDKLTPLSQMKDLFTKNIPDDQSSVAAVRQETGQLGNPDSASKVNKGSFVNSLCDRIEEENKIGRSNFVNHQRLESVYDSRREGRKESNRQSKPEVELVDIQFNDFEQLILDAAGSKQEVRSLQFEKVKSDTILSQADQDEHSRIQKLIKRKVKKGKQNLEHDFKEFRKTSLTDQVIAQDFSPNTVTRNAVSNIDFSTAMSMERTLRYDPQTGFVTPQSQMQQLKNEKLDFMPTELKLILNAPTPPLYIVQTRRDSFQNESLNQMNNTDSFVEDDDSSFLKSELNKSQLKREKSLVLEPATSISKKEDQNSVTISIQGQKYTLNQFFAHNVEVWGKKPTMRTSNTLMHGRKSILKKQISKAMSSENMQTQTPLRVRVSSLDGGDKQLGALSPHKTRKSRRDTIFEIPSIGEKRLKKKESMLNQVINVFCESKKYSYEDQSSDNELAAESEPEDLSECSISSTHSYALAFEEGEHGFYQFKFQIISYQDYLDIDINYFNRMNKTRKSNNLNWINEYLQMAKGVKGDFSDSIKMFRKRTLKVLSVEQRKRQAANSSLTNGSVSPTSEISLPTDNVRSNSTTEQYLKTFQEPQQPMVQFQQLPHMDEDNLMCQSRMFKNCKKRTYCMNVNAKLAKQLQHVMFQTNTLSLKKQQKSQTSKQPFSKPSGKKKSVNNLIGDYFKHSFQGHLLKSQKNALDSQFEKKLFKLNNKQEIEVLKAYLRVFMSKEFSGSALFQVKSLELFDVSKPITNQRLQQKFVSALKRMNMDSRFSHYTSHMQSSTLIRSEGLVRKGRFCRQMFDHSMDSCAKSHKYFKDFKVQNSIILKRTNHNEEIEKAIFVKKNKLIINNLICQEGYAKALISNMARIIDLHCVGNNFYWHNSIAQNYLDQIREEDIQKRVDTTESSVSGQLYSKPVIENVKLNSIIWFINFHPPNEPWVHQEYMDALSREVKTPEAFRYKRKLHKLTSHYEMSLKANKKNADDITRNISNITSGMDYLRAVSGPSANYSSFKNSRQEANQEFQAQHDIEEASVIQAQRHFPFKLNDEFGYATNFIPNGYYQVYEPELAKEFQRSVKKTCKQILFSGIPKLKKIRTQSDPEYQKRTSLVKKLDFEEKKQTSSLAKRLGFQANKARSIQDSGEISKFNKVVVHASDNDLFHKADKDEIFKKTVYSDHEDNMSSDSEEDIDEVDIHNLVDSIQSEEPERRLSIARKSKSEMPSATDSSSGKLDIESSMQILNNQLTKLSMKSKNSNSETKDDSASRQKEKALRLSKRNTSLMDHDKRKSNKLTTQQTLLGSKLEHIDEEQSDSLVTGSDMESKRDSILSSFKNKDPEHGIDPEEDLFKESFKTKKTNKEVRIQRIRQKPELRHDLRSATVDPSILQQAMSGLSKTQKQPYLDPSTLNQDGSMRNLVSAHSPLASAQRTDKSSVDSILSMENTRIGDFIDNAANSDMTQSSFQDTSYSDTSCKVNVQRMKEAIQHKLLRMLQSKIESEYAENHPELQSLQDDETPLPTMSSPGKRRGAIVKQPSSMNYTVPQIHKEEFKDLKSLRKSGKVFDTKNRLVKPRKNKKCLTIIKKIESQPLLGPQITTFAGKRVSLDTQASQSKLYRARGLSPSDPINKNSVVCYRVYRKEKPMSLLNTKSAEKRLQEQKQHLQSQEKKDTAFVFGAIEHNRIQAVEEFVKRNLMGIDVLDQFGNTLLNVSAQYGCYNICDLLIKNGANVNTQNDAGNTPLHYAIAFFHRKIVDLLIENGADESLKNKQKRTPWEGI